MARPLHLPHSALTYFDTGAAAIFTVLAPSPRGTLEILALNGPSSADTALGTATGEPALAFLQKPCEGKYSKGQGGMLLERQPSLLSRDLHLPCLSTGFTSAEVNKPQKEKNYI